MARPQLSIRSAEAKDIADRLALRQKRSVDDVVESALKAYEITEAAREPASEFYARMRAPSDEDDIDLEAIIRENRKPHRGIDL